MASSTPISMLPLTQFSRSARGRISAVLTDIDDTLTDDGRLSAAAYGALEALRAAGILVVPVTGRPAGWCDLIARQWPVDGVVGENGAFWFRYDDAAKTMTRRYAKSDAGRRSDRARLAAIRDDVLGAVPGAAVASDQAYREADLAIDFREDVPPLPREDVQRIVAIFEAHGATAKISSIHVNGWFGGYDKLSTSRAFLAECFGLDLDARKDEIAFVGDSPNDAPMFGFFPHSVGVANVRDFAADLPAAPRYVTEARGGAGFAELAAALIAARI
jgi:HAD superfamily hydrolase (TIGR01484 family)